MGMGGAQCTLTGPSRSTRLGEAAALGESAAGRGPASRRECVAGPKDPDRRQEATPGVRQPASSSARDAPAGRARAVLHCRSESACDRPARGPCRENRPFSGGRRGPTCPSPPSPPPADEARRRVRRRRRSPAPAAPCRTGRQPRAICHCGRQRPAPRAPQAPPPWRTRARAGGEGGRA